jgi:peptidoglycan/xylan/chitin deacetylase (PgdA/CDA1 family)
MRLQILLVLVVMIASAHLPAIGSGDDEVTGVARREIAITLDDLPGVQTTGGGCDVKAFEALNRKLISALTSHEIPALGLVVESRVCAEKHAALAGLLKMWLDAGLELGNHSYSHFDINNTPRTSYEADVIRGEETTQKLLKERGRAIRYFRYPYLHAGKDLETKRAFEKFLAGRGYVIAPVTIDNQEWVFAEVYARALKRRDMATARRVAEGYISYMEEMFAFFERLSIEVVGYEIKQVLLLHVNQINADYLGDLVQMMRKRGYSFVKLERALEDPAYRLPDTYAGPQGLSWLHRWAISKGMKMRDEPREPQWIKELFEARR